MTRYARIVGLGRALGSKVVTTLGDAAKVERPPFREGKRVGLVLAPKQALTDKPEKPERPKSGGDGSHAKGGGGGTPAPAAVQASAVPVETKA